MGKTMEKPLSAKRIKKSDLELPREVNSLKRQVKPASLRRRRVQLNSSKTGERIARALAENSLFQQRLSRLIEATVTAVEKLLGNAKSQPHRAVNPRRRPPHSKLEGERARQMMHQLLGFLRESTTQAIAAGLVKDREGMLKMDAATEERQLLQKRQEGYRDSRDTAIYALDPFYRDDVLRKWR